MYYEKTCEMDFSSLTLLSNKDATYKQFIIPKTDIPLVYQEDVDKVIGLATLKSDNNKITFTLKLNQEQVSAYRLNRSILYPKPLINFSYNKWYAITRVSMNRLNWNVEIHSITLTKGN